MSGWSTRHRTRHRVPRSRAPPRVAAAVVPRPARGPCARRGAGVNRTRAPSRASSREPCRPRGARTRRGASPLPTVHSCQGRRTHHEAAGSPPRCVSLASKRLVVHAYKGGVAVCPRGHAIAAHGELPPPSHKTAVCAHPRHHDLPPQPPAPWVARQSRPPHRERRSCGGCRPAPAVQLARAAPPPSPTTNGSLVVPRPSLCPSPAGLR
jgi:hypothetical protein